MSETAQLARMIDTHCHLDSQDFDTDLAEVIQRALLCGVDQIIIPAADSQTLKKACEIAHHYEGVYYAVGSHPDNLDGFDEGLFRTFANDEKCVAIGECGLDYYRLPESQSQQVAVKSMQKEYFRRHIELSLEFDKPLILHMRDASADGLDVLRGYPRARGVFHCYNADRILLELSDRFYYGIGGVCTFKNARRLLEVLPFIPKERLVLETDAPYLTPHPHRGKRNEPSYIPLIASQLACVLGMDIQAIMTQTTHNAQMLFGFIK